MQIQGAFSPLRDERETLRKMLMSSSPDDAGVSEALQNAEAAAAIAGTGEVEYLKLNPNCCYQCCIGCTSIQKLRAFREKWPATWKDRLKGSERLLREARRVP